MRLEIKPRAPLALLAIFWGLLGQDSLPAAFAESIPVTAPESSPLSGWSRERSPQPTKREWEEESQELTVRFSTSLRSHGAKAARCELHVMREWLKVRCREHRTAAIQFVGGDAKDVYYSIDLTTEKTAGMPGEGEVVLAVREGTSRVIQWWTFGPGYDGPLTVIGSILLQQEWGEGKTMPSMVLSDVLHEPIRTATQDGK